ncbi:MAG TPA: DUF4440 domain-containing protein [Chitinophagaceae bacterium]|nr:DUF4440 domain-containing protein [Chitinophagaceae bacterium]
MNSRKIYLPILCAVILIAFSSRLFAQTEEEKLTATILHLDSAFWKAYNNCDTAHFKDFITNDVEFYHDKGGVTWDAASLIGALDKNICGNPDQKVRREAVAGTVKVYPMRNGDQVYGAIILGEHDFFLTEKGKAEYHSGRANFTQLWMLKNGVWKMSRILSFNHHAPEYINSKTAIDLPAKQLDQLAGTYKSAQSGTMTVTRENKVLLMKDSKSSYTLYPQSATSFFTKDRDLEFQFQKDAAGKPVKMIVKEHGAVADELIFQK